MIRKPNPFSLRSDTRQDAHSDRQRSEPQQLGPLPWETREEAQQQNLTPVSAPDPNAPPVWHTPPAYNPNMVERLQKLEEAEPKRRLIRDAKSLANIRRITQAQMAEEIGVPRRTLEEWLQFRRMPRGPGTTLLVRWVDEHRGAAGS